MSRTVDDKTARPALFPTLVVVGLAAGVMAFVASIVRPLGWQIPQDRLEWDYTMSVLVAGLLGASILLWPIPDIDKRHVLWLWLAKCFVTLGVMLLYEGYYGLDAYNYFASTTSGPFVGDIGFGLGTENITALTRWMDVLLPHSYHAIKVAYAWLGLVAIYLFYRTATTYTGTPNIRILYFVGLFPSVLFWSSILGKDPVILLGIALYSLGIVAWFRRRKPVYLVLAAAGLFLAAWIRLWFGPILILPLIVFPLVGMQGLGQRVALLGAAAGALALIGSQMADSWRLETAGDLLARAEGLTRGWEAGSSLATPQSFSDVWAMARYAPMGMATALFRPLPGEVMNAFGLLASAENLVLIAMVLLAISRRRTDRLREPVVLASILFVLAWSVLYAFVAYNLGSLVRFKLQVLPALLLTLAYLSTPRQRGAT